MLFRLIKCLKAWGAGIGVMGMPWLFLKPVCVVGSNIWHIPVLLFSIFFPALLLFDFLCRKYLRHSFYYRLLVLWGLLALAELEFYSLPFHISQIKTEFANTQLIVLVFFTLLATVLLLPIMEKRRQLIIVQKEI